MITAIMMGRDDLPFMKNSVPAALELADKLIYIDTGALDGSQRWAADIPDVTVVQTYPRVIVNKGFAWVRNEAMAYADKKTEWFYHVDTDEMLSAEQRGLTRRHLQICHEQHKAFSMIVQTFADSNHHFASWSKIANSTVHEDGRHIRIFRANVGIEWRGYIHEELFYDTPIPAPVFDSAEKMGWNHLHFTRYRRWGNRLDKERRFSIMLLRAFDDRETYGQYMSDWWYENWYNDNLPTIRARAAEYLDKIDEIDPDWGPLNGTEETWLVD